MVVRERRVVDGWNVKKEIVREYEETATATATRRELKGAELCRVEVYPKIFLSSNNKS